ncbi:MAG: diguanylate cyclase [Betaproteobacteria bacterium]
MVIFFAVVAGLLLVGEIDYVTGTAIRVSPLYFIPLALAGWRLGRVGAALASLLATIIWNAVLYANGGEYRQLHVLVVNFLTQGIAFLTISMLVAVLSNALRQERSLGMTDVLTGLRTRRAFFDQAGSTMALCKRYQRPVALAYLDLDNFKNVNDSLGHAQGDALLGKIGSVIASSLRATDIAARIGGDEFVILLPETDAAKAAAFCERLRVTLETLADCQDSNVTASIGVAVDDPAGETVYQLLKHADAHMYQAKGGGKNRTVIHVLENRRART